MIWKNIGHKSDVRDKKRKNIKVFTFSRYWILVLVFLSFISTVSAQPVVEWAKTYGGKYEDFAYSIQQTSDGGYIVAGDILYGGISADVHILKIDSNGIVEWEKSYSGSGLDRAYSILQTRDGGYIVAGWTYSFGNGSADVYILKLDFNGNLEWEKTYGGNGKDWAYSVQQTKDNGYIVAGYTYSFGNGGSDVYILKLSPEDVSTQTPTTPILTPTPTPTPTYTPVLTPTPAPTPVSTPALPSTEKSQNPILLLGLILLIGIPLLVIAKSVRKGEPEKTEKRKEGDLEYEQKIKEFKAKLEEWEREGYNVSKLRERWFK